MNSQDIIRDAYYDPSIGFIGANALYKKLKNQGITMKDIKTFMKNQEVVQRNKKNTQKLNSFIPRMPLQEFQVDLIYIEHPHLNQARYALCAIDAFSKKADVVLMKQKNENETSDALMTIFERMGTPEVLFSDEGAEFDNKKVITLCKRLGIKQVFTFTHATMIERFNRTLKERINKYLQSTNSKTITNVLPKIIDSYNNTFHSTIGMTPNEVNDETKHIAQINIIRNATLRKVTPLKVGQKVRVQLKPKSFVKGYKPKFSSTIHTITGKDKFYYYVDDGTKRGYFRSNLQPVENIEINIKPADIEGTIESRLKTMKRTDKNYEIPSSAIEDRKESRLRERKPAHQLISDKYGKISY
jgi:transposase-like protein